MQVQYNTSAVSTYLSFVNHARDRSVGKEFIRSGTFIFGQRVYYYYYRHRHTVTHRIDDDAGNGKAQ